MSYSNPLIRTSMSLDQGTLDLLAELAERWSISKAEVMRRSIRRMKEEMEAEDRSPTPLQALNWLQDGKGLSVAEGKAFKVDIETERNAKRYWWES
jgi:hypothetical protein